VPADGAIDVKGVKVDPSDMKEMTTVDKEGWKAEIPLIKEHFAIFGAKLPKALQEELAALEKRLG
jgi:phosphoenolpyruvate carboxykinase (GTP)